MLEIPHVVTAAAIATHIPNPTISLPLAFVSHFALDMLPHWNPQLNIDLKKHGKIAKNHNVLNFFDSGAALVLGSYLSLRVFPDYTHAVVIFIASFLAVFPDVIKIPYYYFKSKNKTLKRYIVADKKIQNNTTPFWGMLSQLLVTGVGLWWIFM